LNRGSGIAMTPEKYGERIAVVEESVKSLSRRVSENEGNSESLVRLTTLMEIQTEMDKQQNEQMREFGDTLNNVNSNLSLLSSSYEHLKTDMSTIGSRVKSIEDSQEDTKLSIPKIGALIVKNSFLIIPSIILAWLLIQMGLK
jgi:methyl-accepting chemotaxis protein